MIDPSFRDCVSDKQLFKGMFCGGSSGSAMAAALEVAKVHLLLYLPLLRR